MAAAGFVLTTPRLGLRAWRPEDIDLAVELWGDSEVTRFITASGMSRAAIEERLAREIATEAEHGIQYWPMFLLADGAHVGCCGLHPRSPEHGILELGFHIRPSYWRKGLTLEASRAVIDHAFDRLGARGLFAGHHPGHVVSHNLLLKLGFRPTHEELYPPTGLQHPCYLLTRD